MMLFTILLSSEQSLFIDSYDLLSIYPLSFINLRQYSVSLISLADIPNLCMKSVLDSAD